MFDPWTKLALQMASLAWDAQHVIALRMFRLANGGRHARKEMAGMIEEKARAMVEAQVAIARGFIPTTTSRSHKISKDVLRVYRRRVRRNKKRLSRRL
jgi:hypothetical protein